MTRAVVFLCGVVSSILALGIGSVAAAPISQNIGSARVTITVSPDPPRAGSNEFVVQVSGASPVALQRTTVRFSTLMPTMNMTGPAGVAIRSGSNVWRFTATLGMAAPWTVRVQFAGGLSGAANVNLTVGKTARTTSPMTPSGSTADASMSPGLNASAWRTATFALLAVILLTALVLLRNRRSETMVMAAVAALVIAGIAFAQTRSGSSSMDMASMQSAQGWAPVPVTLAAIGRNSGGSTISAPANLQPYLIQTIVARAPGLLTEFTAYTGDRLNAGDVVARLSEPELQSNARAAQSGARAAQESVTMAQHDAMIARADLAAKEQQLAYWNTEIAREKSLLAQGAVSVQEYQKEKAQAATAQSDYDAARAKLSGADVGIRVAQAQAEQAALAAQAEGVNASYTGVVVPDDAVVMKRLVDPGVFVQPGTPILQVAVVNRLRIQAQISQHDLSRVHVGTPIDAIFEDGRVLHGRISSVSPVVDPSTHTAIAEAIVSNPRNRYQPGAFVRAILHEQSIAQTTSFSVPSGAIVGGATTAVWTDVNGTAHRVPVNVISDDGRRAQVTGDLHAGARVVVTGAENLEEGQAIAESGS